MKAIYKTCDGNLTLTNIGNGLLFNESTNHSYEQRLCKLVKVNLKDFGMNKTSLLKNFKADEYIETDILEIERELLQRKTQWYTLKEMKTLIRLMTTSHDWCIYTNQHIHYKDHTPLQIYQVNKKFERKDKAIKIYMGLMYP